jgi:hypothetical protein
LANPFGKSTKSSLQIGASSTENDTF